MPRISHYFASRLLVSLVLAGMSDASFAAQCGAGPDGFDAWKQQFALEAKEKEISAFAIAAFMATRYSTSSISADRGQASMQLSLPDFLARRGSAEIVARGRSFKQFNSALFSSIEARFGVPPGPLLAIWGMETAFGRSLGSQNVLSAVATLAYDCRRAAYFTEQLYASLALIDRRILSTAARGSAHGEIGQMQFMPKAVLDYGDGGNLDTPENALMAAARFLSAHGWTRGAGYQPGDPNFAAIEAWNAAKVYQQAIALLGKQIDEESGARR